ncbi:MAG TPA: YqgE/AlgH family protein [Phnomibacter sp.]|nr:YqgE/AlgH family protein [Phnomibacter sp.]
MNLQAGMYLVSLSGDEDAMFGHATVFITEHHANGSVGFIVNKLFSRTLNELEAFRNSNPIPLYDGGPVDREHLFFIHRRPDLLAYDIEVGNGIFVGGDFATAVRLLNEKIIDHNDIKIFIGYCGWDDTQLEDEIAEEGWLVQQYDADVLFEP